VAGGPRLGRSRATDTGVHPQPIPGCLGVEVNDYLRESQLRSAGGDASRVLVEHLLDHRSGLPHLWSYEFPDRPESQIPRRELLDRFGIVVFEPGTSYHYSNLNYAVAAEVLQASAGQDFGLWIRENLFEPLTRVTTPTAKPSPTPSVGGSCPSVTSLR
jgi:CubicO group peptidase (beta-lactamase class C family)